MGRKVCLNTTHLGKPIRKPWGTDRKFSLMIPDLRKGNCIVSITSNPDKNPNYPSSLLQDMLICVWESLLLNSKVHYVSNQSLHCLLVFVWYHQSWHPRNCGWGSIFYPRSEHNIYDHIYKSLSFSVQAN